MGELKIIVLYSLFSGITILIGGLLARFFEKIRYHLFKETFVHSTIAFGGGVLIAAVAFVLTPQAIHELSIQRLGSVFVSGAFCFLILDKLISRKGGSFAQLMAMLMDFIPEAIALGAVFAHDHRLGLLLAIFIGLQNLPESFNSYSDLRISGYSANRSLLILMPLSLTGVFAAILGDYLLRDNPLVISSLMVFSAGGILYLIFQDIIPLSKMRDQWVPAIGATLGFFTGMVGEKILG